EHRCRRERMSGSNDIACYNISHNLLMINTNGLLTVAEAAKRLKISTEQVRRRLREGKLQGNRIGNQWFIEAWALQTPPLKGPGRLIPKELIERAQRNREAIFRENGKVFDVVAELR